MTGTEDAAITGTEDAAIAGMEEAATAGFGDAAITCDEDTATNGFEDAWEAGAESGSRGTTEEASTIGNAVVSPANVASVGAIAVISASGMEEKPTAGTAVNAAIGFPIVGSNSPWVFASTLAHEAAISTEATNSLVRMAAVSYSKESK
jgi:hypothetical protein